MRKLLVVLDDTRECINAIRFAALRAARTNGGVQVLAVIPAGEIQHGMGVADVMRAEAQDRIEAHFEVFAKWMRDRPGVEPELIIREGDPGTELLAQVAADPDIGVVVLAAASDSSGPGPLVTRLLREMPNMTCPVTIVPGDLSRERLEQVTRG
ncbi:universal stress protein [Paracoccus sp. DMF-8]|uniref:universal stress protein n=1 Tax=Paracoccus sp. DMF-8 TaxID=3019445 RepID=UPI0023E40D44|nr:universal stress protein [Paracoccus sp. DMF-8]MDF3607788.1 universal stress protein [Paracoccus sp. DMF-8]